MQFIQIYRIMDPKTVSITSITIINTHSFRTIYIRRWRKSKYIMNLHIVHHYIPYNKTKTKSHKQYIFQIFSNLTKKSHFGIFLKMWKRHFFRLPIPKIFHFGNFRPKWPILDSFWSKWAKREFIQKSAWNIFVGLKSPN